MAERKPLIVYECPFLMGTEGIVCTAQVTEQQYHTYCREIPQQDKPPNYLKCPAHNRYQQAPIMTMKKIYGQQMDIAHGQARKSTDKV